MSSLLRVQDRSTRGVLLILPFELGLLLSLRATYLYTYSLVPSLPTSYVLSTRVCNIRCPLLKTTHIHNGIDPHM